VIPLYRYNILKCKVLSVGRRGHYTPPNTAPEALPVSKSRLRERSVSPIDPDLELNVTRSSGIGIALLEMHVLTHRDFSEREIDKFQSILTADEGAFCLVSK